MYLFKLEIKRVLRNTRGLVFTVIMPVVFLFMFATPSYGREPYGNGNWAGSILIGMGLYAGLMATAGAGAAVGIERSSGWSRQLRLTPLKPLTYVGAKSAAGLALSTIALAAVYVFGPAVHAMMAPSAWIMSFLISWLGSLIFMSFGLFMGYLLPAETTMQVVGPLLALLAFLGGVFMPLEPGSTLDKIGSFTPLYGLHKLALSPMDASNFSWVAIGNVVAWLVLFSGAAAWKMRGDTGRV